MGKQPSTTTQISKVELPKWVEDASQSNYNFAQEIANKPYAEYGGDRVAGISDGTKSAWDFLNNGAGTAGNTYGQAQNLLNGVASNDVKAGQLADTDLSKYMNPFTDQVENRALDALDRSRVQSLMGNADKATASKAFGGSRSAIVDGVTNAQSAIGAGDLSAQLRKAGFDTAMGLAGSDIDRRLGADTANQANKLAAASGLSSVAQGQQSALANNYGLLSTMGQQQQGQQQKELDAAYSQWSEKENHDLESLNVLLSSLGMSPYGKTENTQKTTESGTDFGAMGLGIFQILAGLSDRDTKTDIQKVGRDKETGLDLYAYRYKGDPKNYPKIVGPMAQDVKKKFPDQVKERGGKLTVNLDLLMDVMNRAA